MEDKNQKDEFSKEIPAPSKRSLALFLGFVVLIIASFRAFGIFAFIFITIGAVVGIASFLISYTLFRKSPKSRGRWALFFILWVLGTAIVWQNIIENTVWY